MAFLQTTAASISSGGTINGDLTISGDLTVSGSSTYTYDEQVQGLFEVLIDATDGGNTKMINLVDADTDTTADTVSQISFQKYSSGTSRVDVGSIGMGITQWGTTGGNRHTYMNFNTVYDGSATEKMRITDAGNVGIGVTPAADSRLHLYSATHGTDLVMKWQAENDAGTVIPFYMRLDPDADTFAFYGDVDNSLVINQTSGNVGIGVAAPVEVLHLYQATDGGDTTLRIQNADAGSSTDETVEIHFYQTSSGASGGRIVAGREGAYSSPWANADSFMAFHTALNNSDVERMRITSTGNVGIGTAAPDGAGLHIHSATAGSVTANANADELVVEGSGATGISILTADNQTGALMFGCPSDTQAARITNVQSTGLFTVGAAQTNGQLIFESGSGTEAMRIDTNGNVGIGTTAPYCPIHVAYADTETSLVADWADNVDAGILVENTQASAGVYSMINFRTSNADARIALEYNSANNGDLHFITDNSGSPATAMTISNAGNLGIGTASPASKLDISGVFKFYDDTTPEIHIVDSDDSNYALIGYTDGTLNLSSNHGNEVGGANVINFATDGGTVRMKLDDNSRISLSNNDGGGTSGEDSTTGNTIFGYLASPSVSSSGFNNVAVGHKSLNALTHGDDNTAIGTLSMYRATSSPQKNVAVGGLSMSGNWTSADVDGCVVVGYDALSGTLTAGATGSTAIGYQSLKALTSGAGNTAVGYTALTTNVDGGYNTAVGYEALFTFEADSSNHGDNTAIGYRAGKFISTGTDNLFVGSRAGQGVDGTELTGDFNTAIGKSAGTLLQGAAHENTFVGHLAGDVLTTGSDNTCIGKSADTDDATAINQTVIGHSTTGQADNSVTLGNASVTDVYMAMNVGARFTIGTGGAVTMPNQPAFLVHPASTQSDIALDSAVTIVFGTEVFDQGADFASNTFTAPVTGRYQLSASIRLADVDSAAGYYQLLIKTSNREYNQIFDPDFGQDAVHWTLALSILADMDASDTAYVSLAQSGGTQQTDITTYSYFSGYLAC
jgi:hypothetical protein